MRTEKCNWMCWILHRKYCNPWINEYNTYPILFTLLQINTNAHVFDMYLLLAIWLWAKVSTFYIEKIHHTSMIYFLTSSIIGLIHSNVKTPLGNRGWCKINFPIFSDEKTGVPCLAWLCVWWATAGGMLECWFPYRNMNCHHHHQLC